MGISFLKCHYCGNMFPDSGEYIRCNSCGDIWCGAECAGKDGYVEKHCTRYDAYGSDELKDAVVRHECGRECCSVECEFFIQDSCAFCRLENFLKRN